MHRNRLSLLNFAISDEIKCKIVFTILSEAWFSNKLFKVLMIYLVGVVEHRFFL